ncbi:LLM class oxidoreductase [Roseovarius sp. C7]|uniref:LLM class oxidoreductase n=1 Tax=Roseovarius sp. C7 TaxID=3398643 RepID=UPI0039F6BEB3
MLTPTDRRPFPTLNQGYNAIFRPRELSLGLVVPIERYSHSAVPSMARALDRAKLAERLGFKALWLRDVPFNVPSFGDAGQIYDPFVYLGYLAAATESITLGVASIVLPLRHPAHVAKAAASVDQLSGGRLVLGVASGDRPDEYPALGMGFEDRGARFRDSFEYIRAMGESYPSGAFDHGSLGGRIDMLPKPVAGHIPMLITGGSQQSPEWIASHGDGWMTYPRGAAAQASIIDAYRGNLAAQGDTDRPVMQSLYVDLDPDDDAVPRPIHLGFRSGVNHLRRYLRELQDIGVNHVALNLRLNEADTEDTLARMAETLLPEFHS